jgi:erythromycin esterase
MGGERPPGYYSRRDRFMTHAILELVDSGETVAFWAHNLHVRAALSPLDIAHESFSVGTELRRRLGDGYRSVGFTWSHGDVVALSGSFAAGINSWPAQEQVLHLNNDRSEDLGSIFARTQADALWLDLSMRPRQSLLDRWLEIPYYRGGVGERVDPSQWQVGSHTGDDEPALDKEFDILVWFRTLTPARRLP